MDSIIAKTIKEQISNEKAIFVLPTQLGANVYSEWVVKYFDISVVSSDRFLSWDIFRNKIRNTKNDDRTPCDSIIRRLFAESLLKQNTQDLFLKKIIPAKYAKNYSGFVSYVARLLPSLFLYKKYADASNKFLDDESNDYSEIFLRYKNFLSENNLFESSYNVPPFFDDGNIYYIFSVETLDNYYEYRALIEAAKNIKIIPTFDNNTNQSEKVIEFSDSRKEINYIARYIKKMHDEKGINYGEIAIHIPQVDTFAPYVEREFYLFNIPYTIRASKKIGSTTAGSFFNLVAGVATNDFSLESLKALLLNEAFPWKDKPLIDNLLTFGKNNNCITNVWEESLACNSQYEREYRYFKSLQNNIRSLINVKSFNELQEQYFIFKNRFFDGEYTKRSDLIMGHIIRTLGTLIDVTKNYEVLAPANPFAFFVSMLSDCAYTSQETQNVVNIMGYKMGASIPYKCNIILDASQNSVSVVDRELGFLSDEKREILFASNIEDNRTDLYLRLYKNNCDTVLYTYSKKTFTGYAQGVSTLGVSTPDYNLVSFDSYDSEEKSFLTESVIDSITPIQKTGFDNWVKNEHDRIINDNSKITEQSKITNKINTKSNAKKNYLDDIVLQKDVSQSSLKDFFFCPTYYYFKRVCKIGSEDGYTFNKDKDTFMGTFDMGNFYHKVFELYFTKLKDTRTPISQNIGDNEKGILLQCVDEALKKTVTSYISKTLLRTQRDSIIQRLIIAAQNFSNTFAGNFVVAVEQSYKIKNIDGRVDLLICDDSEASYTLIDIKSTPSAVPKNFYYESEDSKNDEDIFNVMDFQIPLYTYLIEESFHKDYKDDFKLDAAGFFIVSPGAEGKNPYRKVYGPKEKYNRETFEPTVKRALECVEYYQKVLGEGFDFNSLTSEMEFSWTRCNECFYNAVCRKTFIVEGK